MGGRDAIPEWNYQSPMGKHVRRRRLLDVPRSGRSGLHLRRIPRWRDCPSKSTHARRAQHQAATKLQGEAALQLEYADRAVAKRKGNDLCGRAIPVSFARSRSELGAHFARPDDERSGETTPGTIGWRDGGQFFPRTE